jgi:hypothetical protein
MLDNAVDPRVAIDAGDLDAVWAKSDEWMPTVLACRDALSANGLPRPDGLSGSFTLNYNVRDDRTVAWMLYFRPKGMNRGNYQVGKFLTDYLPDARFYRAPRPLRTNGRDLHFSDGLQRRVRLDAGGLPVPVLVHRVKEQEFELWPDNPACAYVME